MPQPCESASEPELELCAVKHAVVTRQDVEGPVADRCEDPFRCGDKPPFDWGQGLATVVGPGRGRAHNWRGIPVEKPTAIEKWLTVRPKSSIES